MKKIINTSIFVLCVAIQITDIMHAHETTQFFDYKFALVRDLSDSFENSLKQHQPLCPINFNMAQTQHNDYIKTLKTLVPTVFELPGDFAHPDCNFIEDTAIIVQDVIIIAHMGAITRRGEEKAIAETFTALHKQLMYIQAPATMDGGDILYTGQHLFVGLSRRTNQLAFEQLKEIFHDTLEVISIPVHDGLHLKSLVSFFDSETLIIADTPAGKEIKNAIESSTNNTYRFVLVPDAVASNVLRIANTIVIQDGFPESEKILENLCKEKAVKLIKINMSELIKADGALTCGCLLFN